MSRGEGPIRVEHSADGTLVHGTSRDDEGTIAVLRAQGFRWSRRLEAWYLPRTWGEATRAGRVRLLRERLGDWVEVEHSDAPRRSAAERDAEKRVRAAARAERLDDRATRARAAAEAAEAQMRRIQDSIPLGSRCWSGTTASGAMSATSTASRRTSRSP